jgi:hypothetical protein
MKNESEDAGDSTFNQNLCTKFSWSLGLLKAFFGRMLYADEILLFSFVPVFCFL